MIECLLLTLSVCLDSLVASIAYGTNKIKIPFSCSLIISLIGSISLGISLLIGSVIKNYIPSNLCTIISFTILMSLGIYRFFEGLFKSFIMKKKKNDKPLTFKIFDLNFVLQVYANETTADFDKSKTLSIKESIYLAIALSFDSLAIGLASSLSITNYIQVIIISFILGLIAIAFGVYLGKKVIEKSNINISWLSGIILMILASIRLF